MKRLIAASAIVFLFSIPVISYGQPEQNVQKAPLVSQGLVREGEFAIKLVEVLKLGTAKNEAEAESKLASVGIAPKNGWIADYPLTPDIIGELRRAIGVALDSGKLAMKKDEALMAVQILIDNQWKMSVAPSEEQARRGPPKPGTHPPIITHAFAVERGHYGYIWKIYIEADDPDGKMLRIASMVDEVGYGHYPTDWIYLKHQYQKHFKGYIQWNTYSTNTSFLPPWTQITLKVSVFDEAGNESNEVVFPFSFEITPKEYTYTLPAPFDQGDLPRLGYIHVDLYYPGEGGPRGMERIGHW